MLILPVQLVLAAAAGLGAYNLWRRLHGIALGSGVIAAHFLFGVGGAEGLLAMLQASGLAQDNPQRHAALQALLLLALAIFAGICVALLRKSRWAKLALTLHVGLGLAGLAFALALGARF